MNNYLEYPPGLSRRLNYANSIRRAVVLEPTLFGISPYYEESPKNLISIKLLKASSITINKKETSCSICTENILETDIIRTLNSCKHFYHILCIDTWFSTINTCPLCRTFI